MMDDFEAFEEDLIDVAKLRGRQMMVFFEAFEEDLIDVAKLVAGVTVLSLDTTPDQIRTMAGVLSKLDDLGVVPAKVLNQTVLGFFISTMVLIANGIPDAESIATATLHFMVDEDFSISDILSLA